MAETSRECPMCGESMRRVEHERTTAIPGFSEVTQGIEREWVCPECDYFEEADDDDDGPSSS